MRLNNRILSSINSQKLIDLSWYLAQWERFDEAELGFERLAMQTLMVTMDIIQLHQIALKSRLVLDSWKALMSSQYLCGTSRSDTSQIIQKDVIGDASGEMKCVRALINCGTTSIFVVLRLQKWLGLLDKPAYVITLSLNGQVMIHPSESPETVFTVQY